MLICACLHLFWLLKMTILMSGFYDSLEKVWIILKFKSENFIIKLLPIYQDIFCS